jgi:hypothetical protein
MAHIRRNFSPLAARGIVLTLVSIMILAPLGCPAPREVSNAATTTAQSSTTEPALDPETEMHSDMLRQLTVQRDSLAERLGESHPLILNIDKEIDTLTKRLQSLHPASEATTQRGGT